MIQENALARARQQAHENFRQQALERVRTALRGLPGQQPILPRGAQGALSGGGHPESASSLAAHQATNAMGAQLAGANLGGALNGGGAPMLPTSPPPTGQRIGWFGPHGGGITNLVQPPQGQPGIFEGRGPIGLPRLPEQPENLPGSNPLIHLGGGIFLHALTGELHGLGQGFAPRPAVGPVAPAPVAPAPIHPGMAAQ